VPLNRQPGCKCKTPFHGIHNVSLSRFWYLFSWFEANMPSQWNVAFGTPPSSATQSSPPLRPPPTGTGNNYELRSPQDGTQPNYQIPHVSPQTSGLSSAQSQVPATTAFAAPTATYVTPTMWQEVVASSFQDGMKRRWDHGQAPMIDQSMYKRAAR
jgi:hypothetical protein